MGHRSCAVALGISAATAALRSFNQKLTFAAISVVSGKHEVLYWRYSAPQYAVRAGDWKLLFLDNTLRLYNLAADPGERPNLAETNPAKRDELKQLYEPWNAQLPPAP